jgi:hypothetical protein
LPICRLATSTARLAFWRCRPASLVFEVVVEVAFEVTFEMVFSVLIVVTFGTVAVAASAAGICIVEAPTEAVRAMPPREMRARRDSFKEVLDRISPMVFL